MNDRAVTAVSAGRVADATPGSGTLELRMGRKIDMTGGLSLVPAPEAPWAGVRAPRRVYPWAFIASFAAHGLGIAAILVFAVASLEATERPATKAFISVPAVDVAEALDDVPELTELPPVDELDSTIPDLTAEEPIDPALELPDPVEVPMLETEPTVMVPVTSIKRKPKRQPLRVDPLPPPPAVNPPARPTRPQPPRAHPNAGKPLRPTVRLSRAFINSFYPLSARRAGEQGTAVVEITVNERGIVTAAKIHKSSGYDLLDRAATRLMRAIMFRPPGVVKRALQPIPFRLQ